MRKNPLPRSLVSSVTFLMKNICFRIIEGKSRQRPDLWYHYPRPWPIRNHSRSFLNYSWRVATVKTSNIKWWVSNYSRLRSFLHHQGWKTRIDHSKRSSNFIRWLSNYSWLPTNWSCPKILNYSAGSQSLWFLHHKRARTIVNHSWKWTVFNYSRNWTKRKTPNRWRRIRRFRFVNNSEQQQRWNLERW